MLCHFEEPEQNTILTTSQMSQEFTTRPRKTGKIVQLGKEKHS